MCPFINNAIYICGVFLQLCKLPSLQATQHSTQSFVTICSYEQQIGAAYASTHLESMCELDIDSPPHAHRMSGIICTIGKEHLSYNLFTPGHRMLQESADLLTFARLPLRLSHSPLAKTDGI